MNTTNTDAVFASANATKDYYYYCAPNNNFIKWDIRKITLKPDSYFNTRLASKILFL